MYRRIRVWLDLELAGRDRVAEGPLGGGWDLYEGTERVTGVVEAYDHYPEKRQWHTKLNDLISEAEEWSPAQETFPV